MTDKNKEEIICEKEDETPDYVGHRQRLKARFMADRGVAMPDYEILELLLMYAIPRKDVKPLAKALLKRYLNLNNVLTAPTDDLMNVAGVGSNAAVLMALVHACCNKICWESLENKNAPNLNDKKRLVEYCRSLIGYSPEERLLVIYLDIHGRFMRDSVEQVGTLGAVLISPRDIVTKALTYHAASIILCHNHPSGICTPSRSDIEMTRELKESLKTVAIGIEDHIIISPRGYYSMREHLPFMNQK